MKLTLLFLLIIFVPTLFSQSTVFLFSFDSTTVVTINNTTTIPTFSAVGNPTGPVYYTGSSRQAISYSGWNTGKALLFTTSTKGFDSLAIDYYMRCSNSGVGNFKVQVSIDSVQWVDIENSFRPSTSFVRHSASIPSDFSGKTKIFIQILKVDDATATSYNIRLDEVKLSGVGLGPRIYHTPLENSNSSNDRVFVARITGDNLITTGSDRPSVWYRVNGGSFISSYFESQSADSFSFRIPAQTKQSIVDYYLAAVDTVGVVTYPPGGGGHNPPGITPPPYFNTYSAYLFGDVPTITHKEIGNVISPNSATIIASITGNNLENTGVNQPVLWYRINGGAFTAIAYSSHSGSDFYFSIPAQTDNCTVDYYFAAKDTNSIKTSPTGGGGENPLGNINPPMFYSYHSFNKAKSQTYNTYFGYEHCHTWYSDGNEDKDPSTWNLPVARAIEYTRTKANNMDYLGLSDHNHMISLNNWKSSIHEIDSTNMDRVFVALLGQEWGTGGHIIVPGNVLYGWTPGQYDVYVPQNDYHQLWNVLDSVHGFCYLAHPDDHDFQDISYSPFNAKYDRVIKGAAILNGMAGTIDTTETSPPTGDFVSYYSRMLGLGYHVAPVAEQDNHVTTYGRVNQLRTAAIAPSLTQSNIRNAFRDRRVYATNDHNLLVNFEVGPYLMGDIVSTSSPFTIRVKASDSTPGDIISRIEIRYGIPGSNLAPSSLVSIDNSDSLIKIVDQPIGSTYYYYIFVTEADGNNAWTAPIWITASEKTVPVELHSFTASIKNNTAILTWSTASETNNKGFEIEKKEKGSVWNIIGFISGNGTSTNKHIYTYYDKLDGKRKETNYRLKQIDLDGTYKYSNEVNLNVDLPTVYALEQNYPNPFNPSTKINFSLPVDAKVVIKLYNILGKQVGIILNKELSAGNQQTTFSASQFASGIYFYSIEARGKDNSSFKAVKKMILLK
jgi:hypothetical protein